MTRNQNRSCRPSHRTAANVVQLFVLTDISNLEKALDFKHEDLQLHFFIPKTDC